MIQSVENNPHELARRLQDAIREQREVTRLIRELHETPRATPDQLREQRRSSWEPLRGTVTYHGDIVAPLDVKWDAAE
ncbi:MAG: hypothetical protein AAFX76_05200 [Planctomycetota bacterium]